jgi:hypothetical protein
LLNHHPQQNNGNEHNDEHGVEIDRLPAQSVMKLTGYLENNGAGS